MKIELMQLKIEGTDILITCRKLPAIALAKVLPFPLTDENVIDRTKLINMGYAILPIIAVEPSKLDTLNFPQLNKLMEDPQFIQYFQETFGVLTEETSKNV